MPVPEREFTGKYDTDDCGSGRMGIFIESNVAAVEVDDVMLDSIIAARSARVDCGFCDQHN